MMKLACTAVVLLALATPPASAQQARSVTSVAPISAARPGDAGASSARPGDVIRLAIWREPDLSGDFMIDERGMLVLPRLGPIDVTGRSPDSLRQEIAGLYEAFLNHRSISVTLLRRVQVLGAVRNPGLFAADPTMTLGDLLAQAGGATPDGNAEKLQLIRRGDRVAGTIGSSTIIGDSPLRSGDQLFVPNRRWIARYPGIAASTITAATSLLIALTLR